MTSSYESEPEHQVVGQQLCDYTIKQQVVGAVTVMEFALNPEVTQETLQMTIDHMLSQRVSPSLVAAKKKSLALFDMKGAIYKSAKGRQVKIWYEEEGGKSEHIGTTIDVHPFDGLTVQFEDDNAQYKVENADEWKWL